MTRSPENSVRLASCQKATWSGECPGVCSADNCVAADVDPVSRRRARCHSTPYFASSPGHGLLVEMDAGMRRAIAGAPDA